MQWFLDLKFHTILPYWIIHRDQDNNPLLLHCYSLHHPYHPFSVYCNNDVEISYMYDDDLNECYTMIMSNW